MGLQIPVTETGISLYGNSLSVLYGTDENVRLHMDSDDLQSALEKTGELMVNVEEFEVPLELHLHDTDIGEETVTLELADGELEFATDAVTGYWKHYHSLADYGLE